MIGRLLDTSVVSESCRPRPDIRVVEWLYSVPHERGFISILTLADLAKGIEALPTDDSRRPGLKMFASRIEAASAGRILSLGDDPATFPIQL